MRAFYVDTCGDIEECPTVADALNGARVVLSEASSDASFDGEWQGGEETIAWGLMIQAAVEVDSGHRKCERCRSTSDEDHDDEWCGGAPEWQRCVDYQLTDVPGLADALVEILQARPEVAAEVMRRVGDAATDALDQIAALCGCAQWDYPGQVVRDVAALVEQHERAVGELARAGRLLLEQECEAVCSRCKAPASHTYDVGELQVGHCGGDECRRYCAEIVERRAS